jgi:sulfotransferase
MQQLHYCLGLPRTASSLIMNILNENPRIFTTGTCCMPYFFDACHQRSNEVSEFIALDKDVLNKSYINFLRQGMRGWYEAMTDKPIVFSKSRIWSEFFPHTFAIDPNSKYLVVIRDLRDIICSFESLIWKHPQVKYNLENRQPFYQEPFEKRMERYCTEGFSNLGRPLHNLPHVMEVAQKNPNSFFLCKHEHFNEQPRETLQQIYQWLGEPNFEHDFDNIPKPDYYEHDTCYRALVSHKTGTKLKKLEPRWPQIMSTKHSETVIKNNQWYYETFYPEAL